jgi:uncharacterized protein (DUF362 family)/NAD-dependent dihydropyrimidine dehydrogenase PreA subunit
MPIQKFQVSVVQCPSYNRKQVRESLKTILKNIDFSFKKGIKVLIKPNLLSPQPPELGITTHPRIVEELCKILKEKKCKIYIGDSSGQDTDKALRICGISKLKSYAKIINFENEKKTECLVGEKKIFLPEILFKVNLIINLAKLKTHMLTQVTLCVKNLYGCIPGEIKGKFHRIYSSPKDFSKFLVNLEKIIKPQLNIIDGVIGLEGNGPGVTGTPIQSKIIIASKNPYAADILASKVMGFAPESICTNKLSGLRWEDLEIIGQVPDLKFRKPSTSKIKFLMPLASLLPKPKISFDKNRCKKCRICEKKCPVKAITLETLDKFPQCNHKSCIKCLCCIEVCPHKAALLKDNIIFSIAKYVRSKLVNKK